MAEELQELLIRVKVDAETKKIEIVDANLKKVEKDVRATQKPTKDLSGNWKSLASAFGLGAIAGMGTVEMLRSVVNYTKDAIKEAVNEIKSIKQLQVALENNGVAYKSISKDLETFFKSMQNLTRFSDTDMRNTLANLVQATGDFDTGLKLLKISMDVASGTEQELSSVATDFGFALVRQQFGMTSLQKTYGAMVGKAKDVNEAITILGDTYKDYSIKEEGVIKTSSQLRNKFDDIKKTIGTALIPIFQKLGLLALGFVGDMIMAFENMGIVFKGVVNVMKAVAHKNFTDIGSIWKKTTEDMNKNIDEHRKKHDGVQNKIQQKINQTTQLQIKNWQEIRSTSEKVEADIIKLSQSEYQSKLDLLNKDLENFRKIGFDKVEAEKYNTYERLKLREIELAEQERINGVVQTLNKLHLSTIRDDTIQHFEELKINYEADLESYKVQLEEKKITEEEYQQLTLEREQSFRAEQRSSLEEFVGGFKTQYENLKTISTATTDSLTDSFDSMFQSFISTGKITSESLKGYFNDIKDAFISALTKMFAEYLAKKIIFSILGVATGGFSGLVGSILGSKQYGGEVKETGLYQLHKGEEVVRPEGKGNAGGETKSISIQVGNIEISYPNVSSFQDWLNADPRVIKNVIEKKILYAMDVLAKEGKIDDIVRSRSI